MAHKHGALVTIPGIATDVDGVAQTHANEATTPGVTTAVAGEQHAQGCEPTTGTAGHELPPISTPPSGLMAAAWHVSAIGTADRSAVGSPN
ncbi:MAG: hypothetical protein ACYC6M_09095 [Terriglobales bacterium]